MIGKKVWRMCSRVWVVQQEENSMKYARAVASFVLNSGSRTLYALYFGILDRKKSVTPNSHAVPFSLPLFQIYLFIYSLFLQRVFSRAMLSCKEVVCHAVVSFLTKIFPCMEENWKFLHVIDGRERNWMDCSLSWWKRMFYFTYLEARNYWGPGDKFPLPYFSLTLNRQRNYTKFFSVMSS